MDRDVVVVGAGPAGLIAAREAARGGAGVTVLEEHGEVGVPCRCAGLLSLRGLGELGVPLEASFVLNRLRGARFHSPSGLTFTVERGKEVACVVDRAALDRYLARQADRAGAELRLRSRVGRVRRRDGLVEVGGPWGQVEAAVVVDAEGVGSRLVKEVGLTPVDRRFVLPALQFELEGVDVDPAYAEIHVGGRVAPGFFAWVVPTGEGTARVGLACRGANPLERLEGFVRARFGACSRVSALSGVVVTGGPIPKTFDDNLVVVGDAAGQVKPTTGGGVVLGGLCASIAGRVMAEAVERGALTGGFLGRYERLWRRRLGREFAAMRLARRVADRLSDRALDRLFRVVVEENLQEEFAEGDMDLQAGLLTALTRKGGLLRALGAAAPDLLRGVGGRGRQRI